MPLYKDLNLDMTLSPAGDIVIATDLEAIKKSVRNLLQTNLMDVPFDPELGTSVHRMLFENFTDITVDYLRSKIKSVLGDHEPRVTVTSVDIYDQMDKNGIQIKIFFTINATGQTEEFNFFVTETR